jgi:hypothetical protein
MWEQERGGGTTLNRNLALQSVAIDQDGAAVVLWNRVQVELPEVLSETAHNLQVWSTGTIKRWRTLSVTTNLR